MTTDNSVVQPTEPVSVVEPVSAPAEPPKPEPQTPQPLTEERIQQLIAEATQKAIDQGKEVGRREMQAIKDKEVAEANRKARLADMRARNYEESFTGLDEETRQSIELKQARGQVQYYQSAEQEERARQTQEAYIQKLNESLVNHLETLGIDKNDKRVDWAKDAGDYLEGRNKFDASVARILKEDEAKRLKEAGEKQTNSFKEMELKLRKELGLDSVDTSVSGGGSVEGIPTDPAKFRVWIENLSQEEFEKNASKINELRRQGKI